MNKEYIEKFVDRFGLISCHHTPSEPYKAPSTGNGVLFSAVFNAASNFEFPNYEAVRYCVIDGILWRNPIKEQNKDSHDNYTAFAYMMHDMDCRKLFWNCAKKGFYVTGNHMIRFPQVWAMMFLTAYNNIFTKIILAPFFFVFYKLQNPLKYGLADTSGLQLQYLILKYIDMMFPVFKAYEKWRKKLITIAPLGEYEFFSIYYGKEHPTTKLFEPKN